MINLDEDALICDLAETYQIYDYRSHPVKLVATLSAGLRDNSRIRLLAAGVPISQEALLLATIADRIEIIRYMFSDDDTKKHHPPVLLTDSIYNDSNNRRDTDVISFETSDAFEAAISRIRGA